MTNYPQCLQTLILICVQLKKKTKKKNEKQRICLQININLK